MLQDLPNKGFGLLEIVIASGLVAGSLLAVISVFVLAQSTVEFSTQNLQAVFLAEEGLEVLRFLRDSSWRQNISTLSGGTDYYFTFNTLTSEWTIAASEPPPIEGVFVRSFRIESVSRDSADNIEPVYNPANDNPGTKKVIMKVSWNFKGQNQTASLEAYLTNLFDN